MGYALRGQSEEENTDNKENYIKFASRMREFNEKLQNNLKTATVFKRKLSGIQNDIIQSITAIIFQQIKGELSECMYVAISLGEASDVSCFFQLSPVCYVTKCDNVCEAL